MEFAEVNKEAVLYSYPKCGRTWVRYLFLHLYGQNLAAFHHGLGEGDYKKKIILIRDVKDVLVSYYFEVTKRGGFGGTKSERIQKAKLRWDRRQRIKRLLEVERVLKVFGGGSSLKARLRRGDIRHFVRLGIIDDYFDFYRECMGLAGDRMVIRYEDLAEDTAGEIKRLARFLGKPAGDDAVGAAVEKAGFRNMRKAEAAGEGLPGTFYQGTYLPHLKCKDAGDEESYKTREGKVGGYVRYLPEKDIRYVEHAVRTKYADIAEYFGYPVA